MKTLKEIIYNYKLKKWINNNCKNCCNNYEVFTKNDCIYFNDMKPSINNKDIEKCRCPERDPVSPDIYKILSEEQ